MPPEHLRFALEAMRPNPSTGDDFTVDILFLTAAPARLELLGIPGRQVGEKVIAAAGRHTVTVGQERGFRPGSCVVRLSQGGQVESTRAAGLR